MPKRFRAAAVLTCCALISLDSGASVRDDVGYTDLQNILGPSLPSGAATTVDQVEASVADKGAETPIYFPNPDNADLADITINDASGLNKTDFSGHATSVARALGGSNFSLMPELATIDSYDANDWLLSVLGSGLPAYPLTGSGILGNHSWVGEYEDDDQAVADANNLMALQRMDWLIEETGYLHIVGAVPLKPLFAFAMNVIAVTKTSNTTALGTTILDDVYAGNRAYPHLVAPRSSPSGATGTVTSAAGLLSELAAPRVLEPSLIKAILMAGAERQTSNTQNGDIQNYGSQATQNGLDYRYGAGQLDVFNAFQIVDGGTRGVLETVPEEIPAYGFDHRTAFGGRAEVATYQFSTGANAGQIAISLVWNVDIRSVGETFNPVATLYDLDLELVDVSYENPGLIASSTSPIDNTENIWAALQPYRNYEIRVSHNHTKPFNWPYSLAWRIEGWDANGGPGAAPKQIPTIPAAFAALLFVLLVLAARQRLAHV